MANIIFDTNIYIFHSFNYPDALQVWNDNVTDDNTILISTIQISELISYHKIDSNPKLKQQRKNIFLSQIKLLMSIIRLPKKASELKCFWKTQTGKSLKLPDLIIAATAILNNATLFSHNDRDFVFLQEHHQLDYINPIQNKKELNRFINDIKEKTDKRLSPFYAMPVFDLYRSKNQNKNHFNNIKFV